MIAFTAALEIDPKSVAVYTALADAYEAMGDDESLRRILEQGIEATGDVGLKERLAKLPPVLPEQLSLLRGLGGPYVQYVIVDEELESAFADAIDAGLAGNREVLEDAAWSAALAERVEACLKERERREERDDLVFDMGECRIWTQLSHGAILSYTYEETNGGLNYWIEYRPENGNGFYWYLADNRAHSRISYYHYLVRGETSGWLFNGSFTALYYHFYDYGINYPDGEKMAFHRATEQYTGTLADDLLDGERVGTIYAFDVDEYGEEHERNYTVYENFKAGKRQASWTDESGEECTRMIVDDTGEVTYECPSLDIQAVWNTP